VLKFADSTVVVEDRIGVTFPESAVAVSTMGENTKKFFGFERFGFGP
jgi:hypothetical protein